MNNTTTYSVNAANTQSEKSSKWAKVGKIATGIALAGALTMGVAKYAKNSSETNSNNNWEVKTEVVVTPDTEELDSIQLASIDKDVIEISLEEEEEEVKTDAERIDTDRAKITARTKASFQRQAKDWDWVSIEELHSSQKLQQGFLDYISDCKKYWYEPNTHAKALLESLGNK